MKKIIAILMTFSMIIVMCSSAVMAQETAPTKNETIEELIGKDPATMTDEERDAWVAKMNEEASKYLEDGGDAIIAQELEKLYSAEVPEEFYLVPKEKMVIDGWDWDFSTLHSKIDTGELSWEMFNPLYAYIAFVVNHDYLEPKGIVPQDFEFSFDLNDLNNMKEYYSNAIIDDQLSLNLAETYSKYDPTEFKGDAELTECVMRAIYTFCITAGVDSTDFWSARDFETFYGISPNKITFSEEQLHYFDD